MQYEQIYYMGVILLAYFAFNLIWDSLFSKNIIKQKITLRGLYSDFINSFSDKNYDQDLVKAGIKLSIKKYIAYRNLLLLLMLVIAICNLYQKRNDITFKWLVACYILMFLSTPKQEIIKGKRSPFKVTVDWIYRKRQQALDNELISVISQMRGMIVSNGKNISGDYLFTRILPYTKISKPIFTQVHSFLMLSRKEKAAEYFVESYGTKLSSRFASIILKIDKVESKELLKEMEIIQKSITEEKKTLSERKRQTKMSIIFTVACVQVALLIMNLIYIIQMDAVSILKTL